MAPFTAIQELGQQFGQLLKPLKLLRPLFSGLLKNLKLFAAGLKASVVAMLPYIGIAALVAVALIGLYLMLKKAQDFFGKDDKTGLEDYGEDIGGETPVAAENDFGSRMQRKTFVINQGTKDAEFIKPDDPRYDELYEKEFNKPAPKEGQVYMGDGKSAILPLDKEGFVNPFEMRNKPPVLFDNPLKDLAPVDTSTDAKNQASIIDGSSKVINNNSTYTASGLNGADNKDLDAFSMAHKMASA